jgi:hypothetical protein
MYPLAHFFGRFENEMQVSLRFKLCVYAAMSILIIRTFWSSSSFTYSNQEMTESNLIKVDFLEELPLIFYFFMLHLQKLAYWCDSGVPWEMSLIFNVTTQHILSYNKSGISCVNFFFVKS